MQKTDIVNFRDIGGKTGSKGKLKEGYFFRSGQLDKLTKEEMTFLEESCQLKKVFDFRSVAEVKAAPDTEMPGVEIEQIDILASANANAASLEQMLKSDGDVREEMLQTYEQLVVSDSAKKGYKKFLEEILNLEEPILFHCFAGKDRTGFGAALILKIAGISDEDIMTDYLETNELRKAANKALLESVQDQLNESQLKSVEIALDVDSDYLKRAWEVINDHYKDFSTYLTEGLGLAETYPEQFREKFVEPINQ